MSKNKTYDKLNTKIKDLKEEIKALKHRIDQLEKETNPHKNSPAVDTIDYP